MSADLEVAVSKQMAALSVLDVDQAMSRLSSTVARYLSGLTGAHGPTALSLAAMAAGVETFELYSWSKVESIRRAGY